MGAKKAYKVGSVSGALAESSGSAKAAYDPKLCDIFTSSAYKSKPKPMTSTDTGEGKKFAQKLKVKHEKIFSAFKITDSRDAAVQEGSSVDDAPSIRKDSKRKLTSQAQETPFDGSGPEKPSKKKKKSIKKQKLEQDTTLVNVSENLEPSSKPKKNKKGKKAKKIKPEISVDEEVITATETPAKKEKNRKNKKLKATLTESSTEDKPVAPPIVAGKKPKKDQKPKLSGVQRHNEVIIKKFEDEQGDNDSDSDEDSDDDEAKGDDEKDSEKTKKLNHFELNKPKDKNPEQESRTVFVGNLPPTMLKKNLKKLFNPFGAIETIRFRCAAPQKPYLLKKVALNSKKLNPNQYNLAAYIRFKSIEEAEKAAGELNGHEVDQHAIVVDLADNKSRDNKKAIFIGNLPLKIHDDAVRKFFDECGPIHSVRIVRNPQTGLGRGIGYINFVNTDAVELALKKDGETLDGRPIRVSRAVKKEKKSKEQLIKEKAQKFGNQGNTKQRQGWNAARRIDTKNKTSGATDEIKFTGDRLAEIGVLKRKSSKPDKGELKKARIASKLTGVSSTQFKKFNSEKREKKDTKKFNREKIGKNKDKKRKFIKDKTEKEDAKKKFKGKNTGKKA